MGCQCICQETDIFWCLQNERALLSAAIEARNRGKEVREGCVDWRGVARRKTRSDTWEGGRRRREGSDDRARKLNRVTRQGQLVKVWAGR